MPADGFFAELRKRKVVQAAAIYGAVAWGVTEVLVTVVEQLFLPQWVSTLTVIGFVVGFPVAMFLAWTFDFTSKGIKRTSVTSRRGKASIVVSMLLLVAGTAGLFLLIRPSIEVAGREARSAGIPPNSIAVLPFENASRDPDDTYLSEGLSDELRDQLGRVTGLRIAARSSSIAVREIGNDAKASSIKLGVANLVEGSLRRRGNQLRISVQLVDGASGLAIWSESFERGPAELPGLQQDIFENVVRHVLPDAEIVAAPGPATQNANANELMLLARYYEQDVRSREEVDADTLIKAVGLYRDAVALDPQSALANSRLAGALLFLGDLEAAEAPIFRALSLDPDLSEVQHTLGLYYFARGMPEAYTAFRRAVELNPNNADALEHYAFGLWIQGIEENVAELYRRAMELDPLSLARYGALGEILGKQGRTAETLELAQRVAELFDGPDAYRLISQLHELTGQVDEAIGWAIRARDLEPGNLDHVEKLAELYAEIGDFETATALEPKPGIGLLYRMGRYKELIDSAEDLMIDEPEDVIVRYLLAFAYNATGQYESAVWVLSSTGLPGSVMEFPRMGADWEGFFTLINATLGAGEREVAEGMAEWFVNDPTHHNNIDWWVETYMACALAVLGRDAEALHELELIQRSPRLAPASVLSDMLCFKPFADEPVYRAVVEHFQARRAALRERLPATLAGFGLSL
jgi:TolB-like protein/tetratricopeptide (TPR) repeat protein